MDAGLRFLLMILVPVTALFGLIIFLGLRRVRIRKSIHFESLPAGNAGLEIDLTEELLSDFAQRVRRPFTSKIKKGYELSQGKRLVLEMSVTGIRVPVLLVTNPAFWRAVEKQSYQIEIPWADIKRLEVYPAMGKAEAQYLLILNGPSREWGEGAFGIAGFDGPAFGITRAKLQPYESSILSVFNARLGDKLVIRDAVFETSR
jgi:hypothetical protein